MKTVGTSTDGPTLRPGASLGNATENPLKMMRNAFYFSLNVLFLLKIFPDFLVS